MQPTKENSTHFSDEKQNDWVEDEQDKICSRGEGVKRIKKHADEQFSRKKETEKTEARKIISKDRQRLANQYHFIIYYFPSDLIRYEYEHFGFCFWVIFFFLRS